MNVLLKALNAATRWIGVIAAVWYVGLFVVGFLILRPEFLEDAPLVVHFFDDFTTVKVGSWLMALSIVGLVWFLGGLASHLHAVQEGRLGAIVIGGGIIGAASVVIGSTMFAVGSLRLEDAGELGQATGVGPGYLLGLYDGAMILNFAAAPFGFGVVVLAGAAAGARSGRAPTWLTIFSVLLALALWIPPISWVALWVWLAWVLYVAWDLHRSPET